MRPPGDTCSHPTEDLFTPARPDCPNPGRWHAPDSDSAECEVAELVAGLVRALQPDFVLETGTAWGWTTRAIAGALEANGHGRLVSLDVDETRLQAAANLLHDTTADVSLVLESSLDYTPPCPIDFAWLDSLFELRAAEFRRYRDLGALRPGAVVAFHDAGPHYPVRADVLDLAAWGLLRPMFLPTPRGVAICEVL